MHCLVEVVVVPYSDGQNKYSSSTVRLFLTVQFLKRLQFIYQSLVLVLQQSDPVLKAPNVLLLLPSTLPSRFSETEETFSVACAKSTKSGGLGGHRGLSKKIIILFLQQHVPHSPSLEAQIFIYSMGTHGPAQVSPSPRRVHLSG